MSKAEHDIRRKRPVLEYAKQVGNARKACRFFGVSRASFYRWRKAFAREGDAGLIAKGPVPAGIRRPPAPRSSNWCCISGGPII